MTMYPPVLRWKFGRILLAAFTIVAGTITSAVRAADAANPKFDIPANDATVSLKMFREQCGRTIVYPADQVRKVMTNAVRGQFTPEQALNLMLAGTVLSASKTPQGLFIVKRDSLPNVERAMPVATAGNRPRADANAIINMDPFEVATDRDTSYGALNSNSITLFNTELSKMPISADVFTSQFMQDVGATSINDMLLTYGAGMGQVFATPGAADANQPGDRVLYNDRFTPVPMGTRGLSAGYIRRDGFAVAPTNKSSTDNFDVDRVEVLRGPQALLYGAGGAGGTITVSSKQAHFNQTAGSVSERIDQYGSKRTLVDANLGTARLAFRFAVVRSDNQQRRLFIGDLLEGYYGQIAARLPLHTTVRFNAEYTRDMRVDPTGPSVNFGNTAADPRNGYNLGYLILTNQTGATNPNTGASFSKYGAIDNGHLDFLNYNSYGGWRVQDNIRNFNYTANVDTVWTKWLSTNVGFNLNRSFFTAGQNVSWLNAPSVGSNPFSDWAVSSNMDETTNAEKRKQYHVSALLTKDFSNRIKTQTVVGAESDWLGNGANDFGYFLSDSNGNLVISTNPNNLGRTKIAPQWWSIANGPVARPLSAMSVPYIVGQDGKLYKRVELNPRSPQWINPNNPLGIASLSSLNHNVPGLNVGDYGKQYKTTAYYLGNYTSFWHDWVTALVGMRYTKVGHHVANGGAAFGSTLSSAGYDDAQFKNRSYNIGLDGRITNWLRWYVSSSSTYNDSIGFDDFYGNPPPVGKAVGKEIGLKFNVFDNRLSGSIDYYQGKAEGQNFSNGTDMNIVNPIGLNGGYNGLAGRDSWVPVDQKTSGTELILTAAPTPNWRLRLSATVSNGKVGTTKKYGMLYNDQFYADSSGRVTYKDGSPFLVPVAGSSVSKLNTAVDPASLTSGVPTEQLTTAMMGDPTSDYYAWGKGNAPANNGQINKGSDVGRVLQFFTKPGVGTALTGVTGLPISDMQYAWPDPAGTHGTVTVFQAGDYTTGYPVYRVSLTSAYEFSHGWIKGFGTILSLNNAWKWRTYYYADPTSSRILFSQPELGWQMNLNLYYKHKFGRYLWRTQINVANLTNHYVLTVTPDALAGYTQLQHVGVRWDGYPRAVTWTNTISF